ncbi:MAG: hypothetical protein J5679_03135 [Alphaproteobacteria bacterium]|nr:hypothetical protein [Alphaproteobacteria bacterium]
MNNTEINVMRSILRYDVNRAYIGDLTGAELNGAFELFMESRDWDKPIVSTTVHTGYIDGMIICRALWHEMSYNPKRFGTVSPFIHNGKESIYHFCSADLPQDTLAYDIVSGVRDKLIKFLGYNALENKQWYDVIDPAKGDIVVRCVSGTSDRTYKMLAALRNAIHIIASQNLQDVNRAGYRKEMKPIIDARHPNGVRAKKTPYCAEAKLAEEKQLREFEQACEERLDDAEDNMMINADSRMKSAMPLEQYNQTVEELQRLKNVRNGHDSK